MNISWKWLQQYVDLTGITPQQVAEAMTRSSLEVDRIHDAARAWEHVVVARILDVKTHPSADRLHLVTVEDGSGPALQVVCGGTNIHVGMPPVWAAFARIGAIVKGHTITQATIRGERSHGMLCGADELGATVAERGDALLPSHTTTAAGDTGRSHNNNAGRDIWILSEEQLGEYAVAGTPLAEVFGRDDTILSFDVLPNRPDCMGHEGIAREVAAVLRRRMQRDWPEAIVQRKISLPVAPSDTNRGTHNVGKETDQQSYNVSIRPEEANDTKAYPLSVTIDGLNDDSVHASQADLPSQRYVAAVLSGLDTRPSPLWLQRLLQAVGQKPVNAIVDVTNYIALDLAQPLHAFDYQSIRGASLRVHRVQEPTEIRALDKQSYTLPADAITISDADGPMDLAGIMGGLRTAVHADTQTIVLQAAHVHATSVRTTSRAIGLRTDAVARYEKDVNPHRLDEALEKAIALLHSLFPQLHLERYVDVGRPRSLPQPIDLSLSRVASYLGVSLDAPVITDCLERLDCRVETISDQTLRIEPPTFRSDLTTQEELIEEIARLYGYDALAVQPLLREAVPNSSSAEHEISTVLRRQFSDGGFNEVLNYAFLGPELLRRVGLHNEPHIRVTNPLDEQQSLMRTELISGLLATAQQNRRHTERFGLFEIGRVYMPAPTVHANTTSPIHESSSTSHHATLRTSGSGVASADERLVAAALIVEPHKQATAEQVYRSLRALVERSLRVLGIAPHIESIAPQGDGCAYWAVYHPGRSAAIRIARTSNNTDEQQHARTANEPLGTMFHVHPRVQEAFDLQDTHVWACTLSLAQVSRYWNRLPQYASYSLFQPVHRDVTVVVERSANVGQIQERIQAAAGKLLVTVQLIDVFRDAKKIGANKRSLTFRLTFQSGERTLVDDDVVEAMTAVEAALHAVRAADQNTQ